MNFILLLLIDSRSSSRLQGRLFLRRLTEEGLDDDDDDDDDGDDDDVE